MKDFQLFLVKCCRLYNLNLWIVCTKLKTLARWVDDNDDDATKSYSDVLVTLCVKIFFEGFPQRKAPWRKKPCFYTLIRHFLSCTTLPFFFLICSCFVSLYRCPYCHTQQVARLAVKIKVLWKISCSYEWLVEFWNCYLSRFSCIPRKSPYLTKRIKRATVERWRSKR